MLLVSCKKAFLAVTKGRPLGTYLEIEHSRQAVESEAALRICAQVEAVAHTRGRGYALSEADQDHLWADEEWALTAAEGG